MSTSYPVVDLFAGPGGLGEGFSSVRKKDGDSAFTIGVSVEMDPIAYETLTLRAVFRRLQNQTAIASYFDLIQGNLSADVFYAQLGVAEALRNAREEARCARLGEASQLKVDGWIRTAIGSRTDWVLIGGPPCQAYSLAGRSRRTNDAEFENDEKHFLYREYLRIVKKFKPAVFVMENVKGMLSSTHGGSPIFARILEDLSRPSRDVEYEIRSFACRPGFAGHEPSDFIIRSEKYGLPQARHRVILLGVRSDYSSQLHKLLEPSRDEVTLDGLLEGLPRIRSGLSKSSDSAQLWLDALERGVDALSGWRNPKRADVESAMRDAVKRARRLAFRNDGYGVSKYRVSGAVPSELFRWIRHRGPSVPPQHSSRRHMEPDLHRYLFAASYACVTKTSPKLRDFPEGLLPAHGNAHDDDPPHADRFRVQILGRPSTTITSHISKDGHYYIHPDPVQCRSFTVREAARLQTFPDNYFFMGGQTQRYHQIGNAVPPYLASKLGRIVADLMSTAGISK